MEPNRRAERLRDVRRLATIALIALATTGCIGSGSAGSTGGGGSSPTIGPIPKTDVMITYGCPPGAGKCPADQVRRRLECSPTSGDYDNPAAACRALEDVLTKRREQRSQSQPICGCLMIKNAPKAVGYYNGQRRTIRLDACSLCGITGIAADLAVLMPGTQG